MRKLVEKKVASVWEVQSDTRFVYDGWNLVAEVEYHSEAAEGVREHRGNDSMGGGSLCSDERMEQGRM